MAMIERGLTLVARHDLGGAPNGGEGMAMKVLEDGRHLLYVANDSPPQAMCILDVTRPESPDLVWQLPLPHDRVRGNSLSIHGDLLLLANQVQEKGDAPAGLRIFDLADPTSPREVSFFDTSGPESKGVHFVCTTDGRFAHLSTGAADFEPSRGKDHQFYMCVDVSDRREPREVGRWWLPGQRKGDATPPPTPHEPPLEWGFRVHHALSYPARPDRVYLGYMDAGICILDISRPDRPALVSRLETSPPSPGFAHTALPLFDRGLILVSDESTAEDVIDRDKGVWIVDARDERSPRLVGKLPDPEDFEERIRTVGRCGPHNVHENEPARGSAQLSRMLVTCWFSAGVRIFDLAEVSAPREIAWFVPETPPGQRGPRMNDVFADDRGYIYAVDRIGGGLYVLKYTADVPLS